jgi:hypothetical protein
MHHPRTRPVKIAVAPPHSEHDRRHIAEAHHILRQ